jgi:hypothetical protein
MDLKHVLKLIIPSHVENLISTYVLKYYGHNSHPDMKMANPSQTRFTRVTSTRADP